MNLQTEIYLSGYSIIILALKQYECQYNNYFWDYFSSDKGKI